MCLKGKNYFDLLWVVFMGGIFVMAAGYNRKAGLIPMIVSGLCTVLALYTFVSGLRKEKFRGGQGPLADKAQVVSSNPAAVANNSTSVERKKRFWRMAAWMVGFALGVYLFGHLVAIPIFTLLFMRLNGEKWVVSIGCAVGLTLVVYFAFVVATKTTLYGGVLFNFFGGD
jgi:hypothetical protein